MKMECKEENMFQLFAHPFSVLFSSLTHFCITEHGVRSFMCKHQVKVSGNRTPEFWRERMKRKDEAAAPRQTRHLFSSSSPSHLSSSVAHHLFLPVWARHLTSQNSHLFLYYFHSPCPGSRVWKVSSEFSALENMSNQSEPESVSNNLSTLFYTLHYSILSAFWFPILSEKSDSF